MWVIIYISVNSTVFYFVYCYVSFIWTYVTAWKSAKFRCRWIFHTCIRCDIIRGISGTNYTRIWIWGLSACSLYVHSWISSYNSQASRWDKIPMILHFEKSACSRFSANSCIKYTSQRLWVFCRCSRRWPCAVLSVKRRVKREKTKKLHWKIKKRHLNPDQTC